MVVLFSQLCIIVTAIIASTQALQCYQGGTTITSSSVRSKLTSQTCIPNMHEPNRCVVSTQKTDSDTTMALHQCVLKGMCERKNTDVKICCCTGDSCNDGAHAQKCHHAGSSASVALKQSSFVLVVFVFAVNVLIRY